MASNEQEEMSIKTKLSKLHCPFTWEIFDSMIKHSTIYFKNNKDENYEMLDDDSSYPLEVLLNSLYQCYKAVSSADNDEATKRMDKAGEILMQIQQEYDAQY